MVRANPSPARPTASHFLPLITPNHTLPTPLLVSIKIKVGSQIVHEYTLIVEKVILESISYIVELHVNFKLRKIYLFNL